MADDLSPLAEDVRKLKLKLKLASLKLQGVGEYSNGGYVAGMKSARVLLVFGALVGTMTFNF